MSCFQHCTLSKINDEEKSRVVKINVASHDEATLLLSLNMMLEQELKQDRLERSHSSSHMEVSHVIVEWMEEQSLRRESRAWIRVFLPKNTIEFWYNTHNITLHPYAIRT